jgi:preprotein translocase subunit YajC
MFFALMTLLAEETAKPAQPTPSAGEAIFNMLPLLFLFILGYFLLFRSPMKRQEMERKALLESLKKNDKVLTSAGIYGTVVSVSDKEDEVVVQVSDNVRLKMTKGSIVRKVDETPRDERGAAKEGGA